MLITTLEDKDTQQFRWLTREPLKLDVRYDKDTTKSQKSEMRLDYSHVN